MTPARIAELRRVGVLDGTKADDARIALLDIYEAERGARRPFVPSERGIADAISFYLDPVMRDSPRGQALQWAQVAARRRWCAELRAAGWTTRPRDGAWIDPSRDRRRPAFPFTLDGALGVHRARRRP